MGKFVQENEKSANISVRVLGGPDPTEKFGKVFFSLTKKIGRVQAGPEVHWGRPSGAWEHRPGARRGAALLGGPLQSRWKCASGKG